MSILAGLYASQGQYDKAEPLFVACLEQRRTAFGESHPDTLGSMHNLALLYASQGHVKLQPVPPTRGSRRSHDPST